MTDRDRQRLVGVHPDLVTAISAIFDEMDAEQAPMFVVAGLRTAAQQAVLYAQGRSTPGQIVTYKDGITHPSNHQAHADGFGHAVDCAFIGPQPFDPRHPWEKYGEAVEAHGLLWGARFIGLDDRPHAELPDTKGFIV